MRTESLREPVQDLEERPRLWYKTSFRLPLNPSKPCRGLPGPNSAPLWVVHEDSTHTMAATQVRSWPNGSSLEKGSTSPGRPRFGFVKPVTPRPGHEKAGAPNYETRSRQGQPSGLRGRDVKPQVHSSSDDPVRRSRGMACYSTFSLSAAAIGPPQLPLLSVASGCSTWPGSSGACLDPGSGHVLVGGWMISALNNAKSSLFRGIGIPGPSALPDYRDSPPKGFLLSPRAGNCTRPQHQQHQGHRVSPVFSALSYVTRTSLSQ